MSKVAAHIETIPYRIEIKSPTGNSIVADEPVDKGGKNVGFSPKELLAASLSACTSATLRMYIERNGWDIPEINVETELLESEDTTTFVRRTGFKGTLSDVQIKKLTSVANACPVHKILAGNISFQTKIL